MSEARTLNLTIDRATEEDSALGDTWTSLKSGLLSWSGSFELNHDTAQETAWSASTQVDGSVRFYGYPDAGTTTRYYYGFVWVNMDIGGGVAGVGRGTVNFVGDGELARN